uniref:Uncharacterized protein n=1 Tax=Lepeophtheirus salmonis TaxID=72036 RepID=A0A0K2TYK1_LEPSM
MESNEGKKSFYWYMELFIGGICIGTWELISCLLGTYYLFKKNHYFLAGWTIFTLYLPGLVLALGYFGTNYLYKRKFTSYRKDRKTLIYFITFFIFYPVLHISICFYTLWTGRGGRENKLIKLYSGLFNDGPQFILKIIFITYYGFDEKGNTIISLSTMTSFIGLIRTVLQFNDRRTGLLIKIFVCIPLYSTSALAKGLALGLYLKESNIFRENRTESIFISLVILIINGIANIFAFRLAKQDSIRSICYGLASILIPVGFNNDEMYFQQPNTGIADINLVNPQEMRSSYFLLLYGTSNIFIFFGLAYYTFSRTILEYPISTLMILTQICGFIEFGAFIFSKSLFEQSSSSNLAKKILITCLGILSAMFGYFFIVGQCYLGLYLHASLSILMRKREASITTVTDSSIIYWTRPFQ